jgi:hypothetical protein
LVRYIVPRKSWQTCPSVVQSCIRTTLSKMTIRGRAPL